MSDMDALSRMLALAATQPFDVLKDSELMLVAQQTRKRAYPAGELIFSVGQTAEMMIVATSGNAVAGQKPLPAIVGAASILFGLPMQNDVVAGPDGMEALCLAKPHLFTIARECPDFIVGLARLENGSFA